MESRTAESATSWVDRIGLAGIVLMLSVPFLAWHHYYPISSFYSEWLALLCGMGVAVSLLGIRRGDDIILPWLSVGFLGLVLVLGAQIVLETVTHPERNYIAMLNAVWAALLIGAISNLRLRLKGDTVVVVAQVALASAGFLVVVTGFLQYYQLDIFGVHLVEHETVSSYMIGLIGQVNYFANFVACALVSLIYLASQGRVNPVIAAAVGIPMMIALTLSGSRSAWIFAALIPACAMLCHRGNRDAKSTRLLLICLAMFATLAALQFFSTTFGIFDSERPAGTPGVLRLVDSLATGGGQGELMRAPTHGCSFSRRRCLVWDLASMRGTFLKHPHNRNFRLGRA
jgi:hypothetical protein